MVRKAKENTHVDQPVQPDVYVSAAPRTATLVRIKSDGVSPPMVLCEGYGQPDEGSQFEFVLQNGVTYVGTVKEITASAGQVLVEFVDGIAPVRK